MNEKINGIILNVRKYNDSNCIITLYTREKGRLSFISTSGNSKASNLRRAKLQPLSVIEADINFKSNIELQRLGKFSTPIVWDDIYFNPMKRVMAIFTSEFLYKLLNATMPDPKLYDFLLKSISFLNSMEEKIQDFHIPFLISLLSFSGIQPDTTNQQPGYVFEFSSGSFVDGKSARHPFISGKDSELIPLICRINFSNMKCLRFTSANRRQVLYSLLNYYSYHFPGLDSLKSPEILREIFS